MDATPDAVRVSAGDARFDDVIVDEEQLREAQRTTIRRFSWGVAWAVPVVALIVGIWLTSVGQIEQFTPTGDFMPAGEGVFEVTLLAVWPAGLVLLAVGALGVIGAALATAVLMTKR